MASSGMRLWGPRDAFIWYALVRFLLVRLIGRCRPHPPRPTPPGSSAGVGAHLQVLVHLHAARCLESTWRCLESESSHHCCFSCWWCSKPWKMERLMAAGRWHRRRLIVRLTCLCTATHTSSKRHAVGSKPWNKERLMAVPSVLNLWPASAWT